MYSILIAVIAALSGLLIGYSTAIIAGALQLISKTYHLSTVTEELLVSSILMGGLLGAMGGGPIANRYGRKPLLILIALIYLVSAVLLASAHGMVSMIFWRFCLGLAVGASSMVAPLFIAETSPAKWRGALVVGVQLAITLGILMAYCVNYLLVSAGNWRLMFLLACFPALIFFIGLLFLPESPRWLVLAGQRQKARRILERLGEVDLDTKLTQMEVAASEKKDWRMLLDARIRPILILCMGLFLFQNMSGIDGILYYAPMIFERIGLLGTRSSILATVILGSINFIATIIALSLVDANLQSFDHENLYICDGSVIPMLPDKHLTLTIMALADRLAEHLISR